MATTCSFVKTTSRTRPIPSSFTPCGKFPDPDCRSLVGRLALACNAPLDKTPLLKDITNGQVLPLLPVEQKAVQQLLGTNAAVFPAAVREPAEEHAENAPYLDENVQIHRLSAQEGFGQISGATYWRLRT